MGKLTDGLDLGSFDELLDSVSSVEVKGRVTGLIGIVVKAVIPEASVGELCYIHNAAHGEPIPAEVVGFERNEALLMPLGELSNIGMQSEVVSTGDCLRVPVGDELLGRVLDGLGHPRDAKKHGPLMTTETYPVIARPPDPLIRERVLHPLPVGIRALDGVLTVGRGQRVGIFASAGGGKSTLLGMLARNTTADINVIALVGERGREVNDFIEESLGEEGMKRSVLVVATSDEPSLVRLKCAYVATAIAEYFRDKGKNVMLMMDSVTRFARAQREVGLATGEPPARAGFTPSVFSELPKLLERAGNSDVGSITALYTVLAEGEDSEDPVVEETRSILDGHVVLTKQLAQVGHYPAIDIMNSKSRVFGDVTEKDHQSAASKLLKLYATYQQKRDRIEMNVYKKGSDAVTDEAIDKIEQINEFLRQGTHEKITWDETLERLKAIE